MEKKRERAKSEFVFPFAWCRRASGGSFLSSAFYASILLGMRDTASVDPFTLSASDSATRRRCESAWAKGRREKQSTWAN